MSNIYISVSNGESLGHHGILGMRWGVRRFQNYDGTLTAKGRKRYQGDSENKRDNQAKEAKLAKRRAINAARTKNAVDKIVSTMSSKDRKLLGMEDDDEEYLTLDQGEYVEKRFVEKVRGKPVAFLDLIRDGDNLTVALGTDPNHRGKGYANKLTKKGLDWCEKNRDSFKEVTWEAFADNLASRKIAENNGFKYDKKESNSTWSVYKYPLADAYFKEHPNSKLTVNDIMAWYD